MPITQQKAASNLKDLTIICKKTDLDANGACLRCFDTVFWDHTSLLKSALRQSLSCRINVKFAVLFGFGLKFSAVNIL